MDNFKEHQMNSITKIKTINFNYTWTIQNFSLNDKEVGQFIHSAIFCIPEKQDYQWHLSLYPKGNNEQNKDFISLYLKLKLAPNPSINTKITFSILNSKNEEKYVSVDKYNFKEIIGYGFHQYLKQSVLFDPMNDLLPNDQLTIVCKVTAGVETENFSQDIFELAENQNEFTLSSELESLLQSKHMADLTLIVGKEELQAHKTILAARSPVFLAMLQTDMQEKQNSKIECHDVSIDVLREMLQYLYTGTVKNIKEYAYDLVKLADKYDIKGLKLMCEKLFYHELSVNSAVKIFILADRYNCNVLKPLILKFIITHAKDILKTVTRHTYLVKRNDACNGIKLLVFILCGKI